MLNIRDSSLKEKFILNRLFENQMFLSVSHKPLFLLGIGKTWRHSDIMADVSTLASFPFVRMCQIDGLEGIEHFVIIRA